jgi:predicted Holliday junction resolvase-like endonuclease
MAPLLPDFGFNPRDARFIGNPIDYVVFDGLSEGQLRRIVFLEVKTGGGLNANEKQVKAVVDARAIEWRKHQLALPG